jgi:hypothetical protein
MLLFTQLPLSDPWPFFLQGHPESMKIGVGRCHLHVGFPLVTQEEEPDAKCDAGGEPCEGTPNCCLRARILDSVLTGSSRWRPYFHTRCILGNLPIALAISNAKAMPK